MPNVQQSVRIEQSIEIDTTPGRVYEVLTDPNNISRYAGGIEGAEVIRDGPDSVQGAKLELVTKNGNILKAEVVEAIPGQRIVVRDERGIQSTWTIEAVRQGRVRLSNVIEGAIPTDRANQLRYDADVKFQALQTLMEAE